MSRNWIRYIKLVTGDGGQSYDVSNMRIKFKITHRTIQSPSLAEITVYNLSAQTANSIFQQKNSRVSLEAGYQENHGEIYNGWVEQKLKGRETPTETYVTLLSQGSDKAYNNAKVNKTLKAGSTGEDVIKESVKSMKKEDSTIKDGYNGLELSKIKYPQPYVMYGMARKFIRDVVHQAGGVWFITNGEINFMKRKNDSLPGGPVEINAATGMIGSPTQTYEGIVVRVLINPNLKPGKLIRLNNDSIQQGSLDLSNEDAFIRGRETMPGLSPSGTYRILYIDFIGDTHAIPWYAELHTYAQEDPQPVATSGRVDPP